MDNACTAAALRCSCPLPHGAPVCAGGRRSDEMHAALQRLRSFNRHVSHDLRGPLGAMSGVARLTMEALARSDTQRAQQLLSLTAHHAENLAQLVSELLALAEFDDFVDEPVDLNQVARQALEQLALARRQALQGADDGALDAIVLAHLPQVRGSAALLRQVFVNLLGNALKFSADARQPCIEVGAEPSGNESITVYVRDNGIGFDAADAGLLFQPFRRLHGTQFPGTGVGLNLVKRIVERHGGEVGAEAEPGRGACFWFSLRA